MSEYLDVKVGDTVRRMLGGIVPMDLEVTSLDDKFIYCGPPDIGWKFDRRYGYEVDEDLGWGLADDDGKIVTGSYLKKVKA